MVTTFIKNRDVIIYYLTHIVPGDAKVRYYIIAINWSCSVNYLKKHKKIKLAVNEIMKALTFWRLALHF